MNTKDKSRIMPYAIIVIALHIIGIIGLLSVIRQHPFMLGMGILAYTLGLRHAFDVDHIAAIDNTVRKLVNEKKNPNGVGFYFSLGHSSVVFIMTVITAVSVHFVKTNLPQLQEVGGMVGTIVSGTFLLLIGLFNLVILLDIVRVFKKMRYKKEEETALENLLNNRGFFTKIVQPLFKFVSKSWHVYPIGFLFGLGFDTASEIALLTLSAGAVQHALPFIGILSLSILFAAGMSLLDTIDGVLMTSSYKWAFDKPIRKVYYNITVTTISVVAALFIGLLELLQIIGSKMTIQNPFMLTVSKIDTGDMGYILVGLFIFVWAISYVIWKYFKIEEKWNLRT